MGEHATACSPFRSTIMARKPKLSGRVATDCAAVLMLCALAFVAGRITAPRAPAAAAPVVKSATAATPTTATPSLDAVSQDLRGPQTWSDARWHALTTELASPARNAELAAQLEQLAKTDPARALRFAKTEANRVLRTQLLLATVRGWASKAPDDAAHWVLQADPDFRETAWPTLFAAAVASNPDAAVRTGGVLLGEQTPEILGIGNHLIDALTAAGDFEMATRFAEQGPSTERSGWLGEAYAKWATMQPNESAQAARGLADPADRLSALRGVIGGWSDADPAGAVEFATKLPADFDSGAVAGQALLRWTKTDLASATEWINTHEIGAAMDSAIVAVAGNDHVEPKVAASWAENILDPTARSEALTNVLRRWSTSDIESAQHYADATRDLTPDDRKEVMQLFATLAGQSP